MGDEEKKTGEDVGDGVSVNEAQKDEMSRGAISEDEARRLLTEEKQRVETGLKRADKRGKRVLIIVVIVAVILCVAGLVIGVVMREEDGGGKREEVGNGVEEKTDSGEEASDGEMKDVLDKFYSGKPGGSETEDLDALVKEVVGVAKGILNETFSSEMFFDSGVDDDFVVYRPDSFLTVVPLNKVYGYMMKSDFLMREEGTNYLNRYNEEVFPEIERVLSNRGFHTDGEGYGTWSAGPGRRTYWNDAGVVCAFDEFNIGISCGHNTWYDREDAKLSNDLATVLKEATGEEPGVVIAKVGNIQDSEIVPYQRIEASRWGYASAFYRVSPNDRWIYFTSGQSGPACSEYNTEDLKKAFFGYNCYSEGNGWDSRVTLSE